MNFEVHNINQKNQEVRANYDPVFNLYVPDQRRNAQTQDATRKVTQEIVGSSRQHKMLHRAYELPLL
jgi:hypothetical protein